MACRTLRHGAALLGNRLGNYLSVKTLGDMMGINTTIDLDTCGGEGGVGKWVAGDTVTARARISVLWIFCSTKGRIVTAYLKNQLLSALHGSVAVRNVQKRVMAPN